MKRFGSKSALQGAKGSLVLRTHPQMSVIDRVVPVAAAMAARCSRFEIEVGRAEAADNMTTSG